MAMLVEEVPPALASFGEQCPCHATLLSLDVSEHTKKAMLALHYGEGHTVCPVAGCMMPFLVCGKLEAALEEAWVNNEDKLLTLPSLRGTKPMTENEWAILMGDFRLAKVAPPHRPRAKIMGFDSSPDPLEFQQSIDIKQIPGIPARMLHNEASTNTIGGAAFDLDDQD